jgi:hypothetical protein
LVFCFFNIQFQRRSQKLFKIKGGVQKIKVK